MPTSAIRSALLGLAIALCAAFPSAAASLEEMAGQVIIVGFHGRSAEAEPVAAIRKALADGQIGGVMYLKNNIASLDAVSAMNTAFRGASPIAPFITVDQEGGMVERLTETVGFTEIPRAQVIAETNSPEQAKAIYADMAQSLAKLGFTVNFGPVADLNLNPKNQIIAKYGRAFSADAQTVADYDQAFIDAHHAAGILTALKHFPGHGSSTADSHAGFVDISATWSDVELEPYRRLFARGYADMVMVGHLYHSGYSKGEDQLPASLSPEWITGVLRTDLGFKGVVISDDLEMGAIRKHFNLKDTVLHAVRAGMDVLLFSNTAHYDADLHIKIRDILVAEAEADPAFAALIAQSYERILALKQRIGAP